MEYAFSVFLLILAGTVGYRIGWVPGLIVGEVVVYAALWLFHRPKRGY